ncbi:hypothetical protein TNCV_2034341 [Trichonephila clavipes]|nr:hypothetical protein TNCV_2034341 [Trichonephila clavipes]
MMCRDLCARQWRCHHTPTLPTAKSDTFVHARRIIPTATVPPDEKYSYYPDEQKNGIRQKKNIAPFSFLLQFTCSAAHSLRSRRCP